MPYSRTSVALTNRGNNLYAYRYVTEALKLADVDVGPALSSLQALIGGALVGGNVNAVNITASGNLTVTGSASALQMSVSSAPTASSHVTYKAYVDGISYLTAGTGLTKTGSTLSVNEAQTQITSIGTLSALIVSGVLTANSGSFSGAVAAGTPTLASHLTRRDYVDALSYLTPGTGLTKTGSTLSWLDML